MTKTIQDQIDALDGEREKIRKRARQLRERIRQLEERDSQIELEKRRLTVKTLVGKPVRIGYRLPAGDRCAKLNDAIGTLVKVKRTYALIDFGAHGKWNWPIGEVKAADETQGEVIGFVR